MKKVLILMTTGFFIIAVMPAYTEDPHELFITTDPVKADIFINGTDIGKSPVRLRNFSQKTVNLQIKKEGFLDVKEEITLDEGRRKFLFYALSPQNIEITFHQKEQKV